MNKKIIEEVVVSDSARTSTVTNNALRADGTVDGDNPQSSNLSIEIIPERRKRYSTQEKMQLVRLTYLPSNAVSRFDRAHGVAPSMLLGWEL